MASDSAFADMDPASFSRNLLENFEHFDIRDRFPTWRTALKFFAGIDWSSEKFEMRLAKRAANNSDLDDGAVVARRLLDRWRYRAIWPAYEVRAIAALQRMLGPAVIFRPGQWEAIDALVEYRSRVLVVEKTGWGKSVVYFIATHILREAGAGPTILISPLLSLMRNQIGLAERLGLRALTINSANIQEWAAVEQALEHDACDLLLVSPERLGNQRFLDTSLRKVGKGIGLLVVDEAHCISDWGHDFRPDYRRIVRIVRSLPPGVPLAATTATANERVVQDVSAQLGRDLRVQRGPLSRPSLRLQVTRLDGQAERLAWLAERLPQLPGSGIVYCLTVADCDRVTGWLRSRGVNVDSYHADVANARRQELEHMLLDNKVKAVIATVALGMGFDKPDLGFVVHFQRPGSVVAYYQQIGRAGRAVDDAFAILLNGREDDEIQDYFIRSAFPGLTELRAVVEALEHSDGLSVDELLAEVNLARGRMERCLKLLEVDGAIVHERGRYLRTANVWIPDEEHAQQITLLRRQELDRMRVFVEARSCLMEFIARELDDDTAGPCGRCAVCIGQPLVPVDVRPETVQEAVAFLRRAASPIAPRLRWPSAGLQTHRGPIPPRLRVQGGRALSMYGDAGWGRAVAHDKYVAGCFREELVAAAADSIRAWTPGPAPTWVTAVPSFRHNDLVPSFAARLATALSLPFSSALERVRDTPEQKTMLNSAKQAANALGAFVARPDAVLPGPVLLVDDMVDSRWTFTVCGALLRQAGSGPVHPFALASASRGDVHV